jgi:hypothetical protein
MSSSHEAEVQQALQVLYRHLKFVVQKWKNGMWSSIGEPITGKDEAYRQMHLMREKAGHTSKQEQHWRVIQRNEADIYKAGLRDGMSVATKRTELLRNERPSRPLMCLPEHL